MLTDRVRFLGVGFDRLTMEEVLNRLAATTPASPFSFVVTPNVDHVVRLDALGASSPIAEAYSQADMCVCDSRILQRLAKWQGIDLPLVPGSDLTVRLLNEVVKAGDRIAVIGGSEALLAGLRKRFPAIDFAHHQPPMGLRVNVDARREAARFVESAGARFSFIAVGFPQQEMVAAEIRALPGVTGTALCIGASLEFIVGMQKRAPKLLQRLSLEWAYRLMSEPRRMWRRYLVEGPRIFALAARYRRNRHSH